MSVKIRNALIGAGVFVVIIGVMLAFLLWPQNNTGDTGASSDTPHYDFNLRTDEDIQYVQVTNQTNDFKLYKKDINVYVEGYEGLPLIAGGADSLYNRLTQLGYSVKYDDVVAFSNYGLDNPQAKVVFRYTDGSSLTVNVGSEAPGSAGFYVTVDSGKDVYLCDGLLSDDPTFKDKKVFLDTYVTSSYSGENNDVVQFDALEVNNPAKTKIALIENPNYQANQNDTNEIDRYLMKTPYSSSISSAYLEKIRTALNGITGAQVAYVRPTKAELDQCGISAGTVIKVVLDKTLDPLSANYGYTLRVGNKEGDYYYLQRDGINLVFLVKASKLDDLVNMTVENVKSPVLNLVSLDKVKSITFQTDVKLAEFVTDFTGTNKNVTAGGKTIDEANFRQFYQNVIGVPYNGEFSGQLPAEAPSLTVTFQYESGKDVIAFFQATDRQYVVVKNGQSTGVIRSVSYDKLLSDCQKVLAGTPVL